MNETIQQRLLLTLRLFLSPFGRIRRNLYWIGMGVLSTAGVLVNVAYGMFSQPPSPFFPFARMIAFWTGAALQTPGPGAGVMLQGGGLKTWGSPIAAEISFVFLLAAFCLQSKRLHDAGRTAWWPIAFALFQFLVPVGLGYMTRTLFSPNDLKSLIFYGGSYVAVCMLLPVAFKVWIGLMKSEAEVNYHGAQPGTWQITTPERRRWSLRRGGDA